MARFSNSNLVNVQDSQEYWHDQESDFNAECYTFVFPDCLNFLKCFRGLCNNIAMAIGHHDVIQKTTVKKCQTKMYGNITRSSVLIKTLQGTVPSKWRSRQSKQWENNIEE